MSKFIRNAIAAMAYRNAFSKCHRSIKIKVFDKSKTDKMIEYEMPDMRLLTSYNCPVGIYDKKLSKYFISDIDNIFVQRCANKWLKGASAEVLPHQHFIDVLEGKRFISTEGYFNHG